jgi:hypothetical protein
MEEGVSMVNVGSKLIGTVVLNPDMFNHYGSDSAIGTGD